MSTPKVTETHRASPYYTPARAGETVETTVSMAGPFAMEPETFHAPIDDLRAEMTASGIL